MRTVSLHFARADVSFIACAALALAAPGCWQEIEYVGPDPTARKTAATAPTENPQEAIGDQIGQTPAAEVSQGTHVTDEASGFGDELSANLVSESPASKDAESSASQPGADDRYAVDQPPATVLLPHELPGPTDTSNQGTTTDDLLGRTPSEPAPATAAASQANELPPTDGGASADPPRIAADASDAQVPESQNTRLAAWQLGSKLSLAALANDRGVAADKVERWLADSRTAATSLNTTFSALPATGAAGQSGSPSRDVLQYLFNESAAMSRQLADHYGADHAALYEVAVKSNLLLVMYQPGSSTTAAIAAAVREAAPRAGLPEAAVRPLLELVSKAASPTDVRKLVQRLHAQVEQYLSQRMER